MFYLRTKKNNLNIEFPKNLQGTCVAGTVKFERNFCSSPFLAIQFLLLLLLLGKKLILIFCFRRNECFNEVEEEDLAFF